MILGVLLTCGTLRAQSGTSSISGRVTDPQGQVTPGASIVLTNTATGTPRTTVTNESGLYDFSAVPPGMYELTAELQGFKTTKFEKIELRVDSPVRQDIKFEVGQINENVTVQAEVPLVNMVDASLGNSLNEQQVKALPLEARNVVRLLSLQPGTVSIPNPGANDPRDGATNGARADQQTVTLDGVDVNDSQNQTAFTSVLRMTQDALQEFKLSTSNYGAEMGRSSGPQVSLVTKSGSNQFTGAGYEYGRRTATSTNEYFLKLSQISQGLPSKAPKLDKDIYGGALGGPVKRNRIFFFGNYERLAEHNETPVVRNVPSASFRDGVLIYQCRVASACPGTSVQGLSGSSYSVPSGYHGLTPGEITQLDPLGIGPSLAASKYFKQFPLPNDPGTDGFNLMSYRFAAPIENRFNTYISRADAKLTSSQNLFVRFNAQDDAANSAPQFLSQAPASVQAVRNKGVAVGHDSVLSTHLVNTFRYGLTRFDSASLGQLNGSYSQFRFISTIDAVTATTSRVIPTHNVVDDLTWMKDTHTLKFGTNIRMAHVDRSNNGSSYYTATVNPSWTAGIGRRYAPGNPFCTAPICSQLPVVATGFQAGFADTFTNILGVLTQATGNFNYDKSGAVAPLGQPVVRTFAYDEYEGYVQDSWRLSPTLTLNGGVRYSYYTPPWEVNGTQVAPSISLGNWFETRRQMGLNGIPDNTLAPFSFDLAGKANGKRGYYNANKADFAPRVSFAWVPHGEGGLKGWLSGGDRLSIRGGYAKVFDRLGQGLATQFDAVGSFGMLTTLSSPFGLAYETNPGVRFVDFHTLPLTVPAAPKGGFPSTPPLEAGVIAQGLSDNITTPSAHMFDLAFSRELGRGYSFEAAYVGRLGRHTPVRYDLAMPLNLVDKKSGIDYFTAVQQLIRSAQAAGITGNSPNSAYTALAPIAYWENLWAPAAGTTPGLNATQAMARAFMRNSPDYITALYDADESCKPACSIYGPFAYFDREYDSLGALATIGHSQYNGLQLTMRKRFTDGYQFDFNYTLSRSKDSASSVERGSFFGNFGSGGYSGFLINSWDTEGTYSYSDFDIRHQMNFNWLTELPFGRGKRFGRDVGGLLNQFVGDWSVAGLVRWTSGFPFNVQNCRSCWATNWNLQGNAMLVDPNSLPPTQTTENAVNGYPAAYANPTDALKFFRFQLPGESGFRNLLRGDGYFTIDLRVSKAWSLPFANNKIRFSWDTFNLTNTPRFDTASLSMTPDRVNTFGRYNGTLATCDAQAGRCMQFGLRYEF